MSADGSERSAVGESLVKQRQVHYDRWKEDPELHHRGLLPV